MKDKKKFEEPIVEIIEFDNESLMDGSATAVNGTVSWPNDWKNSSEGEW